MVVKENEYKNRFEKHIDELKWLYFELYHQRDDAFGYLCKIMEEYYDSRRDSLKKLDRKRIKNPDWYKSNDIFGMMLYVDNFAGSVSRGELYNDDPQLGDARLCGTTASLCGIEAAVWDNDGNALHRAINADVMLHAYMFTQSGIPVIYSGDEVGQLNDYTYHADIHKKFDSRYLHRGKFDWESAEKRAKKSTYQGKIFSSLRKLEKIRQKYDVFLAKAEFYTIETGSDNVLGICREYGGKKLLAYFNFCEDERVVCFKNEVSYTDLYAGDNHLEREVKLEPYGFIWAFVE